MPAIKLKKVTAEYLAEKEREAEKSKRSLEDLADEEEEKVEKDKDEADDPKPYNFLDVKVLWDKRKRTIPAVEQILIDWLDSNLEQRTDVYLPLQTLYNYYSDVCQMRGASVVDVPLFNRYIREKFGKFYGFQENSPYRVLIKEKKIREKTKVQGETLQLKIRDIITEVLNDAGNPRKGLRFPVISKAIISKYPAQRVDLYPKKLKAALERGVGYGHMQLVRGVGMCGYYRIPGDPTKEEEEDKKEGEEEKEGDEGKTENGTADTDEGKSEEEESQPDKGTKRSAEGDAEDAKDQPPKKKAKKNANKKKKKKPVEKIYRSEAARHSDPQRVEDAFPLAFTYQSDPKEASGMKIMRYISKHYHKDVSTEKMKKVLESGIEKGLWEQTKGNGIQGTYHLLSESFNPGRSDTLSDQVSQALVACHEPKLASAGLIKKYITKYHSKLNIEARPHLFRNALDRACQKGTLRQLSGIGASGTFQLMDVFNPSPAILAGEASDDEEEEGEEEEVEQVEYIPRPTKRGRLPPKPKPSPKAESKPKSKKANAKAVSTSKKSKRKVEYDSDEEEQEVQEPVEYKPKPSKSRGGASAGGRGKQQATPSKKPAKSPAKSSPAKAKSTPAQTKKASNKKSKKSTGKRAQPSSTKKVEEGLDASDEMVMEEYTPRSTKSRGGAGKGNVETPVTSPPKSSKRKLLLEDDDDDLEMDDYVPKPSKSRGSREAPVDEETPAPKKSKQSESTSKRKRR